MPKLLILRGNSGCGKSSTARILREKATSRTALIEQDYLRRVLLKEKDKADGDNIALIAQTAQFALDHGYNVILEGILNSTRYKDMIVSLIAQWPDHFVYYFDVSLEETLHRHATKPNAHEFGAKEMTDWFVAKDSINVEGEKVIPEQLKQEDIITMILDDTKL